MEQQPPRYNNYSNPNPGNYSPWDANDVFATSPVTGKSRGVAALLAILLGALGIHYFYIGKNTAGIVFLLVSILSCGFAAVVVEILALITGIKMFCTTNQCFDRDYVLTQSTFPI